MQVQHWRACACCAALAASITGWSQTLENGDSARPRELLLTHVAEQWGVHTCFAKACTDNLSSLRALRKLAFSLLPMPAYPLHDAQRSTSVAWL